MYLREKPEPTFYKVKDKKPQKQKNKILFFKIVFSGIIICLLIMLTTIIHFHDTSIAALWYVKRNRFCRYSDFSL